LNTSSVLTVSCRPQPIECQPQE